MRIRIRSNAKRKAKRIRLIVLPYPLIILANVL